LPSVQVLAIFPVSMGKNRALLIIGVVAGFGFVAQIALLAVG